MARPDSRTLKDQAATARDKGKHKQALKAYRSLESLEPADGEWSRRAAEMFRRLGKNAEAIAALERAVDKYVQAGFVVKASAACRMILQMDPANTAIQDRLESLDAERTGVGLPQRFGVPAMPPESGPDDPPATLEPTRVEPPRAEPARAEPVRAEPARAEPARTPARAPLVGQGRPGAAASQAASLAPAPSAPVADPVPVAVPAPVAEPAGDDDVEVLSDDALEELDLELLAEEDDDGGLAEQVPTQQFSTDDAALELDMGAFEDARTDNDVGAAGGDLELGAAGGNVYEIEDEDDPLAGLGLELGLERPAPARPSPARGQGQGSPQRNGAGARSAGAGSAGARSAGGAAGAGQSLSPEAQRVLQESSLFASLGAGVVQQIKSVASQVGRGPGQVLFREGAPGDALYMVVEGAVVSIAEGPPRMELGNLGPGEVVGEVAVLSAQGRTATVQAHPTSGAQLMVIPRDAVAALIRQTPAVHEALQQLMRKRLVDKLTATSPLFQPFIGAERRELASRFQFIEVQPGDLLLEQGVKARGFFVLLGGQLETLQDAGGQQQVTGTLGPGDTCGETSLLDHAPADETVRAATSAFLLEMPASVFREVIMTHPQVLMIISDLADAKR